MTMNLCAMPAHLYAMATNICDGFVCMRCQSTLVTGDVLLAEATDKARALGPDKEACVHREATREVPLYMLKCTPFFFLRSVVFPLTRR